MWQGEGSGDGAAGPCAGRTTTKGGKREWTAAAAILRPEADCKAGCGSTPMWRRTTGAGVAKFRARSP